MYDRKLLEAAAKAYWGDEIDDVCSIRWLEDDQAIGYTHGDNQDHNGLDREFVWNPLTDDGDALRLAVKLNLSIRFDGVIAAVTAEWADDFDGYWWNEWLLKDAAAATRRAIVRAAAEVGKTPNYTFTGPQGRA